ncbi:MAG: alpha/beta fold hydrolase, partial [Ilumatobacteraceae bacterium]
MSVVLLHGFTQTGASWAPLLPHLATTPLIAPDLPGHGSAGQVRTDLTATADQLVDEFANPILVGYSMGGRLALHAAIRQPAQVRGLVLIGATPGIADVDEREARRRSDAQLADHVEDIGVEAFLSEWLSQPLFATLPAASRTLVDRRTN